MHSRIFALRRVNCHHMAKYCSKIPETPNEYIELTENELDFDVYFNSFADYVSTVEKINWFGETLWLVCMFKGAKVRKVENDVVIDIPFVAIKLYLERQLEKLQKSMPESIDEFATEHYNLSSIINDKFGFHIIETTGETLHNSSIDTLDGWVVDQYGWFKDKLQDTDIITFRVEGVLDYHA